MYFKVYCKSDQKRKLTYSICWASVIVSTGCFSRGRFMLEVSGIWREFDDEGIDKDVSPKPVADEEGRFGVSRLKDRMSVTDAPTHSTPALYIEATRSVLRDYFEIHFPLGHRAQSEYVWAKHSSLTQASKAGPLWNKSRIIRLLQPFPFFLWRFCCQGRLGMTTLLGKWQQNLTFESHILGFCLDDCDIDGVTSTKLGNPNFKDWHQSFKCNKYIT